MPKEQVELKEIFPQEEPYTLYYLGKNHWRCDRCGGLTYYVPRTYEGPTGACKHCGTNFFLVSTTLTVRVRKELEVDSD